MSMKAVVYQKPFTLKVEQVPRPKIEHPDDIIVKITTTAICGSDLHMYVCVLICAKTGSYLTFVDGGRKVVRLLNRD